MCTIRTILIAEDDDNDFILLSHALKVSGFDGTIIRAGSGDEAIRVLSHAGEETLTLPAVALLDLKMPGKDGFDVLNWRRQQGNLPVVPIVIFSSSRDDGDVRRAYELGAHGFTMKPTRLESYVALCESLQDWWGRCELMGE